MANSERLEIDLPADLAAFVHAKVGEGVLASDSDVVAEAVRVLMQHDTKLRALREMVAASLADPRPSLPADEVAEHFRRRAKAMGMPREHG